MKNVKNKKRTFKAMQECHCCGKRFWIAYYADGSYDYLDDTCDCEDGFSPAPGFPSISEWLNIIDRIRAGEQENFERHMKHNPTDEQRILKLWIDDLRPIPAGYDYWCKSVNETRRLIECLEEQGITENILLDLDHDAGDYAYDGGDYIRLMDWLEETGRNYSIRIHTMNPVGRRNMITIARKNHWKMS